MSGFPEIHDELRAVARRALGGASAAAEEVWHQAATLGWLSLEVPEEVDGAGATFAESAVVLEELGRAAAPGAYFGTAVLGVGLAQAVGASDGRSALLRAVATGTTRIAVALAPDGNSWEAEAPFALRSGRLEGRVHHVVDAPDADRLLLLADDSAGPVVVSVPASSVSVVDQPVLDASRRLGSVEAVDVAVAGEDVWRFVDDPRVASQRIADRAALALAIDAVGVAHAMLAATVDYVGTRRQFDRPIGSFQAVKHQCADVFVDLAVGRQLLDDAVDAVVAGDPDEAIAVSRAKSFVTEAAVAAVGTAMQLHGGIGYTWESGIHRYLKRAMLDRALFGSPRQHRARIGDSIRARAASE